LTRDCRAVLGLEDDVEIAACGRAEARMKVRGHRLNPAHAQFLGHQAIDAPNPRARRANRGRCEPDDLLCRMHTRIRSAGGVRTNRCVGDPTQCLFERLLNGALARLPLPAMKAAAVVFDAESEVRNDRRRFSRDGTCERMCAISTSRATR
jgi:hypothetical protein